MLLCSRTQQVEGSPLDKRITGWTHLRGSGTRREAIQELRAKEASEAEEGDGEKGGD